MIGSGRYSYRGGAYYGYYSVPYYYGGGYYSAPSYYGNYCNPSGYYDQWGNWYSEPGLLLRSLLLPLLGPRAGKSNAQF